MKTTSHYIIFFLLLLTSCRSLDKSYSYLETSHGVLFYRYVGQERQKHLLLIDEKSGDEFIEYEGGGHAWSADKKAYLIWNCYARFEQGQQKRCDPQAKIYYVDLDRHQNRREIPLKKNALHHWLKPRKERHPTRYYLRETKKFGVFDLYAKECEVLEEDICDQNFIKKPIELGSINLLQ